MMSAGQKESERLKQRWREKYNAENNEVKRSQGRIREIEIGVKDKQGVLRTETRERLQRWVEHFSEIFNRDDPTNPVEEDEIVELEEIEEMDLGRWRQ
ncbi:unnamed protein product [Porites evermanni]|uniref:Uncharacterized protein n=1 Tax=Porites evermanni TaxID=104178 RepID=A0ABN8MNG9_9CNID|nr:unnamed protein product [Porites evermanni]